MWTTLAFVAALGLAPSQAGDLSLTKGANTYWLLGPARSGNEYLPGDVVFVAFDMENAKVTAEGEVAYGMAMEVSDIKGKVWYKNEPGSLRALNSLGGGTVQCYAHVNLGLDQPPGDYTLRVTVTDRAAKAQQTFQTKFVVKKPDFGVVQVSLTHDDRGQMFSPALGVPGEGLWVNFWAVGFARDVTKKQPNIRMTMRVLDEDGKPTVAKPLSGEVKENVPENEKLVPAQFQLRLNRAGKFTVELLAEDLVSKKTSKVTFPLTVLPAAK